MCATPDATASCSHSSTLSLGWGLETIAMRSGARSGFMEGPSPVASPMARPRRSRSSPRSSMSRHGVRFAWSATREAAAMRGSSSSRVGASSVTFDQERRARTDSSAEPEVGVLTPLA